MKIMKVVLLTALPVVTNTKCDVSAYISTNVISITDWSNLFESDLFYSWYSTWQLIVGISVSRVGIWQRN
jgi:F-type H+/Na+-transporting ATPase subunit alpha